MDKHNQNIPTDIQDINLSERLGWLFHNAGMLNTVSGERDAIIREEAAMRHFSPEEIEALIKRINNSTRQADTTSPQVQERIANNVMRQIDLMP